MVQVEGRDTSRRPAAAPFCVTNKVVHLPYAASVVHPVLEMSLHGRLKLGLLSRIQFAVKLRSRNAAGTGEAGGRKGEERDISWGRMQNNAKHKGPAKPVPCHAPVRLAAR